MPYLCRLHHRLPLLVILTNLFLCYFRNVNCCSAGSKQARHCRCCEGVCSFITQFPLKNNRVQIWQPCSHVEAIWTFNKYNKHGFLHWFTITCDPIFIQVTATDRHVGFKLITREVWSFLRSLFNMSIKYSQYWRRTWVKCWRWTAETPGKSSHYHRDTVLLLNSGGAEVQALRQRSRPAPWCSLHRASP